jgi:hypothetical protein
LANATQVAGNARSTCALRGSDGSVWCWGERVQLPELADSSVAIQIGGLSSVSAISGGDDTAFAHYGGSFWYSWGAATMTAQLGSDAGGYMTTGVMRDDGGDAVNFSDVAGAESRACGVAGGELYCWGYMAQYTALLNVPGTIYSAQQTASLWTGSATAVALGFNHICVLNDSGAVSCLGLNQFHQLGVGAGPDVLDGVVSPNISGTIEQIDGDGRYTCALTAADEVWCWGDEGGDPALLEPVAD